MGLVTAAQGPLTAGDLAELTGEDEYEIDDMLASHAGRILTPRTSAVPGSERDPGLCLPTRNCANRQLIS